MRKLKAKKLTHEDFGKFGKFGHMINPKAVKLGEEPIEFFRDMVQLDLGGHGSASFSVCRLIKRTPTIIDISENHSKCGEGMLPLDSDIVIHVGLPTPKGVVPADSIELFHVPQGTFVALHPGTWHHAPFPYRNEVANVLIVLPERTYANDCEVYDIPEVDRIEYVES